jgi:hypothetical protein
MVPAGQGRQVTAAHCGGKAYALGADVCVEMRAAAQTSPAKISRFMKTPSKSFEPWGFAPGGQPRRLGAMAGSGGGYLLGARRSRADGPAFQTLGFRSTHDQSV